MSTNVSTPRTPEEKIAKVFALIGQPVRIQILFVLRTQEACVCHLEAVLAQRQASISQHLMVLRKAGLVTAHRDGRNIFYRLARPEVIMLLQQAVQVADLDIDRLRALAVRPAPDCNCPQCSPCIEPGLACHPALAGSKPLEKEGT